jgi:hypothetical protein
MTKRKGEIDMKAMAAEFGGNVALTHRLMEAADHYPVNLPNGKSGAWRLYKSTIPANDVMIVCKNVASVNNGNPESVVSPGTYQVLSGPCGEKGESAVMMSNTQLEYRTNRNFVDNARGDVLVIGLGIGMLLRPLLANKDVRTVTVLELEPDVIRLVKPHYADLIADGELFVYEADAFDFEPDDLMGISPMRWDSVMIDIWPTIGEDNLPDMEKLGGRYRNWVNEGGTVHCWAQDICRRMKRLGDILEARVNDQRKARGLPPMNLQSGAQA